MTLPHVLQDNGQADGDTAGGCQYATVVVYLNDVDKGGETVCSLLGASLGPAAWGQASSALPVVSSVVHSNVYHRPHEPCFFSLLFSFGRQLRDQPTFIKTR